MRRKRRMACRCGSRCEPEVRSSTELRSLESSSRSSSRSSAGLALAPSRMSMKPGLRTSERPRFSLAPKSDARTVAARGRCRTISRICERAYLTCIASKARSIALSGSAVREQAPTNRVADSRIAAGAWGPSTGSGGEASAVRSARTRRGRTKPACSSSARRASSLWAPSRTASIHASGEGSEAPRAKRLAKRRETVSRWASSCSSSASGVAKPRRQASLRRSSSETGISCVWRSSSIWTRCSSRRRKR